MRSLHELMEQDKTRDLVKFVGPNNHGCGGFNNLRLTEAKRDLHDVLDIYSAHTYLPPDNSYERWYTFFDQVRKAVGTTTKPIWVDEYNVLCEWETHVRDQPAYGTSLSEIVAASINAGMQTSMIWLLFDQMYLQNVTNNNSFYNGVHRWGTTKWPQDTLKDSKSTYPAWNAFSMPIKYLGGGKGTKVNETEVVKGINICAVEQEDGTLSLLVVNSNQKASEFRIQLSIAINCSLERHVYDPAKIEPSQTAAIPGVDKTLAGVSDKFTDTLPPGSVAIYSTRGLKK